jgi:hypothetical protein
MQTYKKVLLFILITCFTGLNYSCNREVAATTYPPRKGIIHFHFSFKEFREKRKLRKIQKKQNQLAEKNKKEALKAQEEGRKKHIKRQTPEVQERMKKSLEESEKTRKRKTFWEKLKDWVKFQKKRKKM